VSVPDPRINRADVLRVVAFLERCRGEDTAVPASEIARELALNDTPGHPLTRALITEALREGLAPIGATGAGYFTLRDQGELDRYCSDLNRRAQAILARAANVARAWEVRHGHAVLGWTPEPEEIP